ncbi:MAG: hypothetical protein OXI79_11390 [Gammaproteobacteria bacterium]|nr:hypothetical protein [Gammaproteobacteria bacterium]
MLGNHFHLVLRHDTLAGRGWSDEEVARRWVEAFPPTESGEVVGALKPERRELILDDPGRVARARCTLGSMSHFMKHLKQPIARRANLEDDRTGHFFEQRFYSGALLTEEALVAAMAYVDLNPVRAELAQRIEEIRDTSICDRLLENSAEALADYLRPVLSGLDGCPTAAPPSVAAAVGPSPAAPTETPAPQRATCEQEPDGDAGEADPAHACDAETDAADAKPSATSPEPDSDPGRRLRRPSRRPRPHVTLGQYIELVRAMAGADNTRSGNVPDRVGRWRARTMALGKRQRAYGSEHALRHWTADRAMQLRESPGLPAWDLPI